MLSTMEFACKNTEQMLIRNPERLYLRFNTEIVFSTIAAGSREQRVSWKSDFDTCNKYFTQNNV
jgi:predicted nucleic acid-binding protein